MMQSVFELEPSTTVQQENSYLQAYPHLLSYFAGKQALNEADLVRGAHMIYGWMPTILTLYSDNPNASNFASAAALLSEAKNRALSEAELQSLKALINNSIVGASKLLHFVAPERYAIWDSRIYAFCSGQGKGHHYQINSVTAYMKYMDLLHELTRDARFGAYHQAVNKKVGYDVSKLRALELIMFLRSPLAENGGLEVL